MKFLKSKGRDHEFLKGKFSFNPVYSELFLLDLTIKGFPKPFTIFTIGYLFQMFMTSSYF